MSKQPLFKIHKITDLRQMLSKSARLFGDKTAVTFQSHPGDDLSTRTYKELLHDVESFGTAYLELAGRRNETDKVALIAENRYEWIVSYLGVVNSGRVIVPIDKELSPEEMSNLLDRCKAKTVIFSDVTAAKIKTLQELQPGVNNWINFDRSENNSEISWWDLLADGADMLAEGNDIFASQEIDPGVLCTLIFTSGTTGKPKGVMLTHRTLTADMMGFCQMLDFTDETYLSLLPLNHSLESMCGFLCQLYRGSHIYYLAGGLRELSAQLQIAKPTLLFAVPLIVEGSYKRALADVSPKARAATIAKTVLNYFGGRLRKIVVGGAPMSPEMIAKYDALNIPVLHGAGLTESSPVIAVNPVDNRVDSSVGLPLPNVKIMIDDGDSASDTDGVGEILVKGDMVMLGYFKDKPLTDKTIVDGWLHTGDLGFIDDTGHVHITGRQKNVILGKNGKNVYPEELEHVVNNLKFISESLVYGEVVAADIAVTVLVIPDEKAIFDKLGFYNDIIAEQIVAEEIKRLNETLPKHKLIRQVRLGKTLPRNSNGKVKRS